MTDGIFISGYRILKDTPASDLVTETDKTVEDMISTSLKAQYPDYK